MAEAVDAFQALGHGGGENPHAQKTSMGHPQEQNTTALAAAMVSCLGCPLGSLMQSLGHPPGGGVGAMGDGFGGSNADVQCPDNACSGFAQDSNGDWKWVQFNSFEGGPSGYFNAQDLTNGINAYNGQLYNDANYQSLLKQVYASQVASQCKTVSGNLSADAPTNSGANVGSCGALYIQGSHANFQIDCGTWNGGDCAGRWPGGLHIEGNPTEGFWGHNDTTSYYIGSQFNWASFNPWNFVVHGAVDVLYGSAFTYMFPH